MLGGALTLGSSCAGPTGPGAPALSESAQQAILDELVPGRSPGPEDPVLAFRIAPVGERALAAVATARADQEGAEPGADATLCLLERTPAADGGTGWRLVDEKPLAHAWQTQDLTLELDPAALELAPGEAAASAVFGVGREGEERRSTTVLFRVGDEALEELLRFRESDSGEGPARESVRARVHAEPAAGRARADLVLEIESETCRAGEPEPRCETRTGRRVYRWSGSRYEEAASPAAPASGS